MYAASSIGNTAKEGQANMMHEITDITELRDIELAIAKKIHTFCEQNDIRYCLSCGSLIGSVRHKGFIPWDDDIDMFMPRPDYEKFLGTFREYGSENGLFIASNRTEHYFARTFLKVCDARTVLTETKLRDKEPLGVFVDIWPLDGLPDNRILRALHMIRAAIQFKALICSINRLDYMSTRSLFKRAAVALGCMINYKKAAERLDKTSKKYPFETGGYVNCYARKCCRFERKLFDKSVLSAFEDTQFYIPENYDRILKIEYGDYLKLPPVEQRFAHHVFRAYWVCSEEKAAAGNCK